MRPIFDEDAITTARAGFYPPNIAQDVQPERLRRYFVKEEAGYRMKKKIREMVVFATQNVIKDPPFTRLDLLSCRNLMIYLEPGGVLFLSPSESIGDFPELFKPLSCKWKFYRATGTVASIRAVMSSGLLWTKDHDTKGPEEVTSKIKETNFVELSQKILLKSYAPASVVTDLKGNLLFVHGDTGRYLRPAPGQATLHVVDMARDGLQLELRAALNSASQGEPVLNREVSFKSDGELQSVNLNVRPLPAEEGGEKLLLVSFQEVTPPAAVKSVKKVAPGPGEAQRSASRSWSASWLILGKTCRPPSKNSRLPTKS